MASVFFYIAFQFLPEKFPRGKIARTKSKNCPEEDFAQSFRKNYHLTGCLRLYQNGSRVIVPERGFVVLDAKAEASQTIYA